MSLYSRDDIRLKVVEVIQDVLLSPLEDVPETAQLISELGVESIDLLDILYQLEDTFSMEVEQPLPVFDSVFFAEESEHFSGNRLTKAGLAVLESFSFLNEDRLQGDDALGYLRSVGLLVDLIVHHLAAKGS